MPTNSVPKRPNIENLMPVEDFPDPFLSASGVRVKSPTEWPGRRRDIQALLLAYEYGHLPPPGAMRVEPAAESTAPALDAPEEQLRLACGSEGQFALSLRLTVPRGCPGQYPVIVTGDLCWGRAAGAAEAVRRGYALAEFDRTDAAPDSPDQDRGVLALSPGCDGGTLAAWAWGFHRVVDYLVTRPDVDPRRIIVTGHSRGGKAALLAGALDERVALTAPNDSGCGGAGSFRHQGSGSEDLDAITSAFPYWFHPRLRGFAGQEDRLPFDQHFLLSLVAPRALLTTNALGDLWANPAGGQQTYLAAREVYRFLGAEGRIGNHYREGVHAQTAEDWDTLLDFADAQFQLRGMPAGFDGRLFPGHPSAFSWIAPGAGHHALRSGPAPV